MSKLLTVREIAKILNTTPASVYSYITTKRINFYKLGNSVRIQEGDFKKYLNKNNTKENV
jgi:excisionase family DNA binding protein